MRQVHARDKRANNRADVLQGPLIELLAAAKVRRCQGDALSRLEAWEWLLEGPPCAKAARDALYERYAAVRPKV